jgi:hypothetical protein
MLLFTALLTQSLDLSARIVDNARGGRYESVPAANGVKWPCA